MLLSVILKNSRKITQSSFRYSSLVESKQTAMGNWTTNNWYYHLSNFFLGLFKTGQYQKASELFSVVIKEQNSTDPEVLAAQAVCISRVPNRGPEAEALAKRACYIGNEAPQFVIKQVSLSSSRPKSSSRIVLDSHTSLMKFSFAHFVGSCLERSWKTWPSR